MSFTNKIASDISALSAVLSDILQTQDKYPHISQAFSDSVPERTTWIKGFHWHLKYHLNIPLLPEKASFRNYIFPDSFSFL